MEAQQAVWLRFVLSGRRGQNIINSITEWSILHTHTQVHLTCCRLLRGFSEEGWNDWPISWPLKSLNLLTYKHIALFRVFSTTESALSRPRWCKLIGSIEQESILACRFCCSIWEWFLLPDGVTSQPCLCYSASLDASHRAADLCDSAVVHPV